MLFHYSFFAVKKSSGILCQHIGWECPGKMIQNASAYLQTEMIFFTSLWKGHKDSVVSEILNQRSRLVKL